MLHSLLPDNLENFELSGPASMESMTEFPDGLVSINLVDTHGKHLGFIEINTDDKHWSIKIPEGVTMLVDNKEGSNA